MGLLLHVSLALQLINALGNGFTGAASQHVAHPASVPSEERQGPDACTLLPERVIEKTLGEPLKQTRSSSGKRGEVIDAQCLYSLPTFSNSVSLSLTLPAAGDATRSRPRKLWMQRFHEAAEQAEEERRGSGEREAEASRPVPVEGIGDEAFWVRSFVGTLYVLKGNAFLRISLGGKWDDAARLKIARTLADNALASFSFADTSDNNASRAGQSRSAGSASRK